LKNTFITLIAIFFLSLNNNSYSDNHFPITRDSELMFARGKIAYQNNCASCHQVNLSGAEMVQVTPGTMMMKHYIKLLNMD